MSNGFVYVLANSAMPDLVKVGFTTRSPSGRAAELGGATGVPVPFMVVYQRAVHNCEAAERYLHMLFEQRGHRVASNREFFNAPVWQVIEAIVNLPNEYVNSSGQTDNDDDESPLHEEDAFAPWQDLWDQAVAAHYGLGNEFKDPSRARKLYRSAAQLGCNLAFYRIGMIDLNEAEDRRGLLAVVDVCREGVLSGNYACNLLLAKVFLELEDDENAAKAIVNYFGNRKRQFNASLENLLYTNNALAHVLGQAIHVAARLDTSALVQLQAMRDELVLEFDNIIDEFERAGESLHVVGGYHEARHQIESL